MKRAWRSQATLSYILGILSLFGSIPVWAQSTERSLSASLRAEPPQVYVHQPFILTLSIRAQNVALGKQFNLQGLPSGDILELEPFQELPTRRESIGTTVVEVREFRCAAKALRPGAVGISPMLIFQEITQERTWLGSTTFQSQRQIGIQPLTLPVMPLPTAQQPVDFSGAIGQFTFKIDASPREAAVGDLITLALSITGNGHLEGVTCPALAPQVTFKAYAPRLVGGTAPGELRHEQIVIPLSPDATNLPGAHFTYFDPLAEQYRTLEAAGGTLRIHTRHAAPQLIPYRPENGTAATPPPGTLAGVTAPGRQTAVLPNAAQARLLALPRLALLAGALLLGWSATSLFGAWRRRRHKLPAGGLLIRGLCQGLLAVAAGLISRQMEVRLAQRNPVWTIQEAVTARIAPSRTADPTVELIAHTPVIVTETWEDWLRVADGQKRGWIPAESASSSDHSP